MTGHAWFVCCCLMINQCFYTAIGDLIYPGLAEQCPDRTFCRSNATKVINDSELESCCQSCSCKADCFIVGNCCPDADIPDNTGGDFQFPVANCTSLNEMLNSHRITGWNHDKYYKVIMSCPALVNVPEEVVELCYSPLTLLDHTPVSSLDGDKLYRNQHCARCNGDVDVVPWNVYVTECYTLRYNNVSSLEDMDERILSDCMLEAEPISHIYGKNTYCIRNAIKSTCNVTGRWLVHDAELQTACETVNPATNDMYKQDQVHRWDDYYNNIYCFFCNNDLDDIDMASRNTCTRNSFSVYRGNTRLSFTILLSFRAYDTQINDKCQSSGEVYDAFLDTCHQVLCSVGMLPVHGSCQALGSSTGIPISIVVAIRDVAVHTDTNSAQNNLQWIATEKEAVLHSFSAHLQNGFLPNCAVDTCDTFLLSDDTISWGGFFFQSVFASSSTCSYEKMIGALNEVIDIPIEFKFETPSGPKSVLLSIDLERTVSLTDDRILAETSKHICRHYIESLTRQVLQLCPRIRLSVMELGDQLSNETINRLLDARTNTADLEFGSFDICLSTYNSIMKNASCPLNKLPFLLQLCLMLIYKIM